RGGVAECMVAWYLAGRLGLGLSTRPAGKPGKRLEFAINAEPASIHVEVKAPYVSPPLSGVFWGDDSDVIETVMTNANKQFEPDHENLLVIVPELRFPLFKYRYPLIRAFIGEQFIVQLIDKRTGGPVGPVREEFKLTGRFTKLDRRRATESGKAYRFTRVSAVLVIEQRLGGKMIEHDVLLLHNPNAERPLRDDIWADTPQCKACGDSMSWSDGFPMTM
ncbi:MAG TPA: hypothetical protein PKJ56_04330, partial [Promineifilum sp.]|nr:hypothetical protein [Promineifilum sp.]